MKWAVELGQFDIKFQPRTAIKAQALADFVAEFTPGSHHICPVDLTGTTEIGIESGTGIAQPLIQDTQLPPRTDQSEQREGETNHAAPSKDPSTNKDLVQ